MKKHILAISLLLSTMTPALALDVGDISSFMNSESSTLSKEIKNTTDSGRLINIHMERLSSPLDGGKVIPMDKQDEILLTPASLLLPAKASDVIRFFYKGPADDKERYYRMVRSGAQRCPAQWLDPQRGRHGLGTHRHYPGGGAKKSKLPLSVRQRHAGQYR